MPSSSSCCTPFLQSGLHDMVLARSSCCLPCLQDVLSALVAHLGSCNLSEADVALDSLLSLAKSQAGLQEHADALATSMIEWLEFFDTAQIYKVGCQVVHAACAHTATLQPDELAGFIHGFTQLQKVGCPHQLAASHLRIQGRLNSHNRQRTQPVCCKQAAEHAAACCSDAGASVGAWLPGVQQTVPAGLWHP